MKVMAININIHRSNHARLFLIDDSIQSSQPITISLMISFPLYYSLLSYLFFIFYYLL